MAKTEADKQRWTVTPCPDDCAWPSPGYTEAERRLERIAQDHQHWLYRRLMRSYPMREAAG